MVAGRRSCTPQGDLCHVEDPLRFRWRRRPARKPSKCAARLTKPSTCRLRPRAGEARVSTVYVSSSGRPGQRGGALQRVALGGKVQPRPADAGSLRRWPRNRATWKIVSNSRLRRLDAAARRRPLGRALSGRPTVAATAGRSEQSLRQCKLALLARDRERNSGERSDMTHNASTSRRDLNIRLRRFVAMAGVSMRPTSLPVRSWQPGSRSIHQRGMSMPKRRVRSWGRRADTCCCRSRVMSHQRSRVAACTTLAAPTAGSGAWRTGRRTCRPGSWPIAPPAVTTVAIGAELPDRADSGGPGSVHGTRVADAVDRRRADCNRSSRSMVKSIGPLGRAPVAHLHHELRRHTLDGSAWLGSHCAPAEVSDAGAGRPNFTAITAQRTRHEQVQKWPTFPVFQHVQENDFGITLADVLPTLTGERE